MEPRGSSQSRNSLEPESAVGTFLHLWSPSLSVHMLHASISLLIGFLSFSDPGSQKHGCHCVASCSDCLDACHYVCLTLSLSVHQSQVPKENLTGVGPAALPFLLCVWRTQGRCHPALLPVPALEVNLGGYNNLGRGCWPKDWKPFPSQIPHTYISMHIVN